MLCSVMKGKHAIKMYRGDQCSSCIHLTLGTEWMWAVVLMVGPLYNRGKASLYPLKRRLNGPHNRYECCGKWRGIWPLTGIKQWFIDPVTIPTTLLKTIPNRLEINKEDQKFQCLSSQIRWRRTLRKSLVNNKLKMHDFRLPPRSWWELRWSGLLRNE